VFTAAGLLGVLALPAAAQDLTIVSVVKGGPQPMTQTQYLAADQARTSTGDTDVIVQYGPGRIITIDNKKKEYTETTFAEMAAALQKVDAEMAKMPAFLQKSMGGGVKPVTVQKGTATRQIAGYECTQYTLTQGDEMVFDIWAAPAIQVPTKYVEAMKARWAAMGPMGRRFSAMYDEMAKIKGYPLSFGMGYKLAGKKIDSLIEATEVKKGPIPASVFEIPAGYKPKPGPFAQK
jgi:hypothetical protein